MPNALPRIRKAAISPLPVSPLAISLLLGSILACAAPALAAAPPAAAPDPASAAQTARVAANYAKLPLSFEANQGQTDKSVQYLSHGNGYTLFLRPEEAVLTLNPAKKTDPRHTLRRFGNSSSFSLAGQAEAGFRNAALDNTSLEKPNPPSPDSPSVIRMQLVGANPHPIASGLEPQITRTNYFTGNDQKQWHTNIPNYARVKYSGIYPGIDLVYYGNQRQLEHDFIVAPNADPSQIVLRLDGSTPNIDPATGDLILETSTGELRLDKPVTYQTIEGQRREVPSAYKLLAANKVGFKVGDYDHAAQLTIDPTLVYSTYFGGSGGDNATGIAVDPQGNAYVIGETCSFTDFPLKNPIQTSATGGCGFGVLFVSEIQADGAALVYSTYLGSDLTYPGAIAVDAAGNAYITGGTFGFPTVNAFQPTDYEPYPTGFVAEIQAGGGAFVFSTYLGGQPFQYCTTSYYGGTTCYGEGQDVGNDIAVDSAGNIYVTGATTGINFPTYHAFQSSCNASTNFNQECGFLTVFKPGGQSLLYSTYLSGNGADGQPDSSSLNGIAVDSQGDAYVTGSTATADWPVYNALDSTPTPTPTIINCPTCTPIAGGYGVLTVFKPDGQSLLYSTYLPEAAYPYGIALDKSDNAYVAGPGFITEIQAGGSRQLYKQSFPAAGGAVAVDGSGNAYVTGSATGNTLPLVYALQCQNNAGAGQNSIVAEFASGTGALLFSTYLGGSYGDYGAGIAVDSIGNVLVTGGTGDNDFPTLHPFQAMNKTGSNGTAGTAFVYKIGPGPQTAPPVLSPVGGTFSGPHTVSISDNTPGATIYYTDVYGAKPTTSSTLYTGPFTVDTATSIAAFATSPGANSSAVCSTYYGLRVADPAVSAVAGRYDQTQTITLSDATAGAKLYYTLHGTAPTSASTLYTGPFNATTAVTVSAIGLLTGYQNSNVVSQSYEPPAAAPILSPATGAYSGPQQVTMSSATAGAKIYYTTVNGATPTTSSTLYTGPFTVNTPETVAAIATASGHSSSAIGSTFLQFRVAEPAFNPGGGSYAGPIMVTLSDVTPGASIRYTTDGSAPGLTSTLYTGPITVAHSETIHAIGILAGYENSTVGADVLTIH